MRVDIRQEETSALVINRSIKVLSCLVHKLSFAYQFVCQKLSLLTTIVGHIIISGEGVHE